MLKVFGIPNCDSCRRTRQWLDDNSIDHEFHDFRKDGIDGSLLERIATGSDWERMLNKRSKTWRTLAEHERTNLTEAKALRLMEAHPTLIKRPILICESAAAGKRGEQVQIGFTPRNLQAMLS